MGIYLSHELIHMKDKLIVFAEEILYICTILVHV
jgi:hypothetical protein